MKKWTTQLIGLTLLLAAVAACGGEVANDPTPTLILTPTPTVVASDQVPADWHLVEVPLGQPRFSLRLPPGWQLNELQGIDSIVGEIMGEGVRMGFDFGWYSNPLADDDDPLHIVTYEDVGGRRAKLVRPKEGEEGSVGVYFEDFDNLGEASFPVDLLTIVGMDLSDERQETAFTIFRSVRGYDSDLAPGPTSGVGPGISIGEALSSTLEGPLLINGHLHAQSGRVRLCELLAESFPPQCGGKFLAVEGLDLTTIAGLASEGSVTWSDQLVQVLGTVEGGVLTVAAPERAPGICCKPVQPDSAAEVRFTALGWQDESMPLDWLAVRFDTGEGAQTLSGSQLVVDEDYAQPHSQWFPTDTSGTLTVDFTLTSPSPESLSAGRVQLQLKDDWRWEIQFHLTEHDPLVGCFGCAGAERFLLSTESLASLWVVWGGNSISDPVVY